MRECYFIACIVHLKDDTFRQFDISTISLITAIFILHNPVNSIRLTNWIGHM